jgi:hypothetical protein
LVLEANKITWKSKVKHLERDMTKQNDQHLKRVLKERERHLQLYSIEAEADSLRSKNESHWNTIIEQRDEIKALLVRISKYAPTEFSDTQRSLAPGQTIDLVTWQLTREAATDEALIAQLREQVATQGKEIKRLKARGLISRDQVLSQRRYPKPSSGNPS